MQNRFLYVAVFVSGMTTLAIELTASRLLGAVFGTSNLVWASIIGLILVYLTAGYFLGGKWADRSPHFSTMYTLVAWGAFTSGLVPLLAKPLLPFVASAFDGLEIGILAGAFAGVLILFSVPVTLLGTVSPFAIRLALRDSREAGRVSGRIYAISTLGSFAGTFLPVLFLIPQIGTAMTFLTFSLLLILVAFIGLWLAEGGKPVLRLIWMPLILIGLALLWANSPLKRTQGQIFEGESAYNYIEVIQEGDYRYLRLNEGQGIHSMYHPTQLAFHGPWMQFLAAPFFNPDFTPEQVERMAIVGLAAGTTVRQATAVFGPIPIDGFEIDPEIIAVGRRFFDMNEPNLNARAMDGRWGLASSREKYTIIGIDAYRPPYIPWHLTTQEFFRLVRDHLTGQGVLVINVGRAPQDRRLIEGLVGTIRTLFPTVYVMDIPDTFNSIIYATVAPTSLDNLEGNLAALQVQPDAAPLLVDALQRVVEYLQPTPDSQVVFTDDRAPIEWLTNAMVLRFLLSGGAEDLK